MSRLVGPQLPPELYQRLFGGAIYRNGRKAVPIITVDGEGNAHVAIVNCAVAVSPDLVRLPIAPASATMENLQRSHSCTIVIAEPGYLFYIKGTAREEAPRLACHGGLSAVTVRVTGVWSDSEKFYQIESGMTYSYREHEAELRTLEERIIAELSAPPPESSAP